MENRHPPSGEKKAKMSRNAKDGRKFHIYVL